MTTTTIVNEKMLINSPVYLTPGQTSGSFKMSIPFPAAYILVLNDTEATIAVCIGEQASQPPDAQIWSPGAYISMPLIEATQKVTVFWTSQSAIAIDNNLVQFYFSNITIPIQGGSFGSTSASSNVDVMNTVTTQFAAAQDVNVETMPILTATDGTNTHQLQTDTEGNLKVNLVNSVPSNVQITAFDTELPEGTNNIGSVIVQARNDHKFYEGSIGTTEVIFDMSSLTDGNCNQIVFLENDDQTNDLWVSFDSVTVSAASTSGENGIIHLKPGEGLNDIPRQTSKVHFIRAAAGGNVRFLGV